MERIKRRQRFREVLKDAIANGIPISGQVNARSYFDAYRSEKLPTNIIQAQRDYLVHIPMNVFIGKVSFTHFEIKQKKLEDSINLHLNAKKRLLYIKAAFYN
ncbi:6-phosphogluconate dehydrogenase, decarboxylating [compost metagenome]